MHGNSRKGQVWNGYDRACENFQEMAAISTTAQHQEFMECIHDGMKWRMAFVAVVSSRKMRWN